MSHTWLPGFIARLEAEHVLLQAGDARQLAPAHTLELDAEDWSTAARVAAGCGCRWTGIWADLVAEEFVIHACLAWQGDFLVLQTRIPVQQPLLTSHTPHFPGAARMERHLQDLYGIVFSDHPDNRHWTRHQAWAEDSFPLRPDFPVGGIAPKRTPPDSTYRFVPVLGSSVVQIPVGPVHAGIIEPGHFRFHAVGETVLQLEERLGYVHKGIEKIAVGRTPDALARLAARVSGDSTVAHGWAACMAMERAAGVEVAERALFVRAILAERERIANHLGDVGAICNDVSFSFAYMQFSRLREDWLRSNQAVFGHRLLMDRIVPGGVLNAPDTGQIGLLQRQHQTLLAELVRLTPILEDDPALEDRLVTTGILSMDDARQLGVTGFTGKASGIDCDLRRDHRYAPYDRFSVQSPCVKDGDVAARMQIRLREIRHSLQLLDSLLQQLPDGPLLAPWPDSIPAGAGLGLVEGWRGDILCYVRFTADGRVARYFPRDPSWFTWPALERLIHGNIVPDFPVCNKSINGSYSGHDL